MALAALVFLRQHCGDGWSYLGKAVAAILRGDPHRSRHLAYYAELRAAMSLLASEGIGVFNRRHVAINAPHSVMAFHGKPATHVFVWDCLQTWGDQRASGDLFAQIVSPAGRTLDEWLQPEGGAVAVAPQARRWFLQWGMDLRMPVKDRDARNESSYRPDGLPVAWYIQAEHVLAFAKEFWSALEPAPSAMFEHIDRHILRLSIESVYRGKTGSEPSASPNQFKAFVTKIVKDQNFATRLEVEWVKFLCREVSAKDLAILHFSKLSPEIQKNSHLAVISRAALLLRLASGANTRLLKDAGYKADDIRFWWSGIGNARGLWDGVRGNDLVDLWADIPPLLQDIDAFQSRYSSAQQTFFRVGSELSPVVAGLGSCERVAVWSLTAL
jgi:hypothetical protein